MGASSPTYPDRVRRQVKEAWVSGQYGSVAGLAKAFGMRRQVIYTWRRAENWDAEKSRVQSESSRIATERLINEITQCRNEHFKVWGLFDLEIAKRFKRYQDAGEEVPIEELDVMSKVFERAQRGRYFAKGQDIVVEEKESRTEIVYAGLEEAIAAARAANGGELPVPPPVGGEEPDRIPLVDEGSAEGGDGV